MTTPMNEADLYSLAVFWSEEDKLFIAEARDLPGCSAAGETQEEAIAEVRDAIASWLEAAKAVGRGIPQPSTNVGELSFSGKLMLRMPRSLHASLARRAELEGVSLNQLITHLLSSAVGKTSEPLRVELVEPRAKNSLALATTGGVVTKDYEVLSQGAGFAENTAPWAKQN